LRFRACWAHAIYRPNVIESLGTLELKGGEKAGKKSAEASFQRRHG
jgi:hypothetical protein